MGRNGFFNMIYFGFYHTFKDIVPQADNYKLGNLFFFSKKIHL